MKIIEQSYQILAPDPLEEITMLGLIEDAGRLCYKSEDKITDTSYKKFVANLIKGKHHSVIEHSNITVRFITDRGVTHELVRHRLASYSQESTRYCDYSDDMLFICPVWCDLEKGLYTVRQSHGTLLVDGPNGHIITHSAATIDFLVACCHAETSYQMLRKRDWSPQQARAVLPNSLKTEIIMTANLREWRHVLDLRCSKAAHPQIRSLMLPLLKELSEKLPEAFTDIYDKYC